MIARASLWPQARLDIDSLPSHALRVAAARAIVSIQDNPWRGVELRARAGVGDLTGPRRTVFDEASWTDKPRYRVVYRLEPDEGVVEVVAIIAVGLRDRLAAYRIAARRIRAERRRRLLERD